MKDVELRSWTLTEIVLPQYLSRLGVEAIKDSVQPSVDNSVTHNDRSRRQSAIRVRHSSRKFPTQGTVCEVQCTQLINEARSIDRGTNTCDIGWGTGRAVLPTDGSSRSVECIHVADPAGGAAFVCTNE